MSTVAIKNYSDMLSPALAVPYPGSPQLEKILIPKTREHFGTFFLSCS